MCSRNLISSDFCRSSSSLKVEEVVEVVEELEDSKIISSIIFAQKDDDDGP